MRYFFGSFKVALMHLLVGCEAFFGGLFSQNLLEKKVTSRLSKTGGEGGDKATFVKCPKGNRFLY